jgi:hypothetical protein
MENYNDAEWKEIQSKDILEAQDIIVMEVHLWKY